jgi:hypothetical protein
MTKKSSNSDALELLKSMDEKEMQKFVCEYAKKNSGFVKEVEKHIIAETVDYEKEKSV